MMDGNGSTCTLTVCELLQPDTVPETVNVVLLTGFTVVVATPEPVDHVYVVAPLALRVAVCPEQIVALLTANVGVVPTVMFAVVTFVQDPVLPVMV
jgi:hypothetical protein